MNVRSLIWRDREITPRMEFIMVPFTFALVMVMLTEPWSWWFLIFFAVLVGGVYIVVSDRRVDKGQAALPGLEPRRER